MKTRFLPILFVFVCALAQATSPPPVILVLGDSLSSAYGLAVDEGWVNLLQTRLKQHGFPHQVINASSAGDTTANGLTRLDRALQSHQPRVVVVELGGNDGLRAQPLPMIAENLDSILQKISETNAEIVLAGMRLPPNYGPFYVDRFEQIYPRLAHQYNATLIPFFMQDVATKGELMQEDGIHPNAQAQPVLLDNVWAHLQQLLELPAER